MAVYVCPAPVSVRIEEEEEQGEWQMNGLEGQKASLDTGRS